MENQKGTSNFSAISNSYTECFLKETLIPSLKQ